MEEKEDGSAGSHEAAAPIAPVAPAARDSQVSGDADGDPQSHSHDRSSDATLSSLPSSRGMRNPFDPRVSFKNPFPKFEDSMTGFRADADDDNEVSDNDASVPLQSNATAVNLDWSIDTIAELKPMAFSPLPEQKTSGRNSLNDTTEVTPDSTASNTKFNQFFDDESQYKVLQTPSPLIRQQEQEQQSRFQYLQQSQRRPHSSASPSTPGPPPRAPTPPSIVHHSASRRAEVPSSLSASSSDLHRRCQDAIAFCEDRVRERKLSRLQLPQSWSNSFTSPGTQKNSRKKNKRERGDASEFPWNTTPKQRTSELRGIHPRTPATANAGTGTGFLPSQSPFSVLLTPIKSADQVLKTPERNPKAAAQRESGEPEFSFDGGSPISPIAPFPESASAGDRSGSSSNTLLDKTIVEEGECEEEEEKEDQSHENSGEASLSPIPMRAPAKDAPSFGSLSFSHSDEEHDKENRKRQQPNTRTKTRTANPVPGSASSSSSDSPSFTLSSSWGKAAEDSFSLETLARLQSSGGSLSSISFVSSSSLSSSPPANPDPDPRSDSNSHSHSEPRFRSQASRSDKILASSSIAQRQESFMAAIEAEARASASSKPQTSSPGTLSTSSSSSSFTNSTGTKSAVSVAELFQEARALGISEPRAQWEYVQLLKKQQRGRHHL